MIRSQLAEFMKRMDQKSVAIIPAAREATRSNDTQYRYRQDSDFLYLTGFEEPESIAIIAPGREQKYTLFVRPRDPEREIWDGKRAGVEGAKSEFGAEEAFPIAEFDEKLHEILDGANMLYYRLGVNPDLDDKIIREIARMRALNRKPIHPPRTIIDPATIVHEMRVLKSAEEIELMQRAADIAAEAHVEAMKAVRPGMNEFEVEALLEHYFRRQGASGSLLHFHRRSGARTLQCCTTSATTANCATANCCWLMPERSTKATLQTSRGPFPSTGTIPKRSARSMTWCWKRKWLAWRWCGPAPRTTN